MSQPVEMFVLNDGPLIYKNNKIFFKELISIRFETPKSVTFPCYVFQMYDIKKLASDVCKMWQTDHRAT